jgi:hypothetical protein
MRISIRSVLTGCAAIALACMFSVAIAQDSANLYDIELVIFRVNSPTGTPEQWTTEEGLANETTPDNDADESGTAAAQRSTRQANVIPLAPEQFKLTAIEDTLRRSREYQPIAHLGWTQPGYPLNAAPGVVLADLLPAGAVSGKVALSRGHYLHLNLDLVYQSPSSGQHYVMRQSRRMRSNEKHFFDHPYFGVIAIVTPHNSSAG